MRSFAEAPKDSYHLLAGTYHFESLSVRVCGLGECSHRFSRLIYRPFFRNNVRRVGISLVGLNPTPWGQTTALTPKLKLDIGKGVCLRASPRREITARGRHVEIDVHATRLQSRRAAALRRRERGAAVRKLVRSSLGSVVERSSDRLCQVRLVHKLLRLQPMPAAVPEPPALPAAPAAAASTAVACRGPGACRQRAERSRRLHQAESPKRRQDLPRWREYLRDCRLLRPASGEYGADVDGPLLGGRAD